MTRVFDVNPTAGLSLVDGEYVPMLPHHVEQCEPAPIISGDLRKRHFAARIGPESVATQLRGWLRLEDVLRSEHGRTHRPGQMHQLCPMCVEEANEAVARR